jgi:anti-anti-sigma regulatory factor
MDAATADAAELSTRLIRLASAVEAERDNPGAIALRIPEVIETLRAAVAVCAKCELSSMVIEAKDEQIARQAEVLNSVGHPVLHVRAGVLCVPVVGPIDFERARMLLEAALHGAVGHSARHLVIDLTGALIQDPDVAVCLSDVARSLSFIGVRVALSGIRSEIAKMLVDNSELLKGISTYPTLAVALESIRVRR